MAIGGVFAILLFEKERILNFLLNKYLFYSALVVVLFLMINGIHIRYIDYEFYSVLFGIIILNFAEGEKLGISLENRPLNYLGNISYGLYMYHPIAIVLALYIAIKMNVTTNWFIYPLSILLTIVLAAFSFRYFETFFLKFKNKFSNVLSGN